MMCSSSNKWIPSLQLNPPEYFFSFLHPLLLLWVQTSCSRFSPAKVWRGRDTVIVPWCCCCCSCVVCCYCFHFHIRNNRVVFLQFPRFTAFGATLFFPGLLLANPPPLYAAHSMAKVGGEILARLGRKDHSLILAARL